MDAVPAGPFTAGSGKATLSHRQQRWWATPSFFFGALALLLIAHIVERVWITPLAFIDEGWQLVLAQHWSIGYAAHPPLYTWLQIGFFKVFGESILALALLKNLLIFALYAFTYASGRILTRRHMDGVFAALCLMIVPQIGWECHRDLTHSVLLAASTAATLFSFLWLVEKPSAARYAFLGASVGAALLSKYNSAVFIGGFALAALLVKPYRTVLLDRRCLIAFAAGMAVSGPHLVWAAANAQQAFAAAKKVEATHFTTYGIAGLILPLLMAKAFLPNLTPTIVTYALARPKPVFRLRTNPARVLFWGTVISLVALGIALFLAKAGGLRGRWFMPIYVCGPAFLVAQLAEIPSWLRRLVAILAIVGAFAVLAILPINAHRQGAKRSDLTLATVENLKLGAGDTLREADLIIAETFWIGGNLRLQFRRPVATPYESLPLSTPPRRIAVVFIANHSNVPSKSFHESVNEIVGRPVSLRVVHLSPSDPSRRTGLRVGVAVVESSPTADRPGAGKTL